MTIKQALKEKNRLVKEMTDELQKIYSYNSIEVGNERPYSTREALTRVIELENELIELKTKIHTANLPVYNKIFRLSELKNLVSKLKQVECISGKKSDRYSRQEPITMECEVTVLQRDNLIKKFEKEIESIQDELDIHNATTKI